VRSGARYHRLSPAAALARSIASARRPAEVNSPLSGCSPGRCATSLGATHRPV
jgi:hypothetical protein